MLRHIHEKWALAVNAGGLGLWEQDLQTGAYFWNDHLYRLLGYTEREVPASTEAWLCRIHNDDREAVAAVLADARARGVDFQIEYRVLLPGGNERWVEERGRYTYTEGHSLHHGVVVDVTDRKNLEAELRRSHDQLAIALKGGDLGFWAGGDEKQYWDETLYHILGYDPETVPATRSNFYRLVHSDDRQRIMETIAQASMTGDVVSMELRITRPDGAVRWIESRFRETNREKRFRHGVIRDITERKNRDEYYLRSQRLEAAAQLLGGMVHDFNNLLAIITASLERAEVLVTEPAAVSQLRATRQAAVVGGMFNRRLIGLSQMRKRNPVSLAIGERILSFLEAARSLIRPGILLSSEVASDLCDGFCDELDFECAIINLLVNARDAISGDGYITVSACNEAGTDADAKAQESHEFVRVTVRDSGCGMDRATRNRASEAFFSTKGEGAGTGLGLTSVAAFMADVGGRLEIESALGEGTSVSILIPSKSAGRSGSGHDVAITLGEGQLVLVVDDDALMREDIMQRVEALGYTAEGAAHAQEAIAKLRKLPLVACVLSDISMPGELDGFGLAGWMADNTPLVPAILISGHDHLVRHYGAVDERPQVLAKSCSRRQLASALADMMEIAQTP